MHAGIEVSVSSKMNANALWQAVCMYVFYIVVLYYYVVSHFICICMYVVSHIICICMYVVSHKFVTVQLTCITSYSCNVHTTSTVNGGFGVQMLTVGLPLLCIISYIRTYVRHRVYCNCCEVFMLQSSLFHIQAHLCAVLSH